MNNDRSMGEIIMKADDVRHSPLSPTERRPGEVETVDLTQLKEGDSGVVVEIHGGHGLVRRLESLGIRAGKKVTKVSSQLMRGPVTVRVDNSQIAIGYGMAKKIMVEQEK